MRDNSDTCAEIELFHLVLVFLHTPCAIAPIRAMLNKIAAGFTGTTVLLYTGTPCAMTLIRAILNKTTAALLVLRMVLLWFYKFHSEVCEVCAHTRTHTHTQFVTRQACAMSDGAGAQATASQAGGGGAAAAASSSADRGATPADPLAAGEAIDELLAANRPPRTPQRVQVPRSWLCLQTGRKTKSERELHPQVQTAGGVHGR